MEDQNYPTRALAAYYRQMAQQKRVAIPLDDMPSQTFEATVDRRGYVVLRNRSRTLAVYRVKPGGLLRRLKRYPRDLDTLSHR